MKCRTIIQLLEELAPPKYAEEWDNPGLLLGRAEKKYIILWLHWMRRRM